MSATDIAPRSRSYVEDVLAWVGREVYLYASDLEVYKKPETWVGAYQQFLNTGTVRDDCDGFSRFIIALMLFGGFHFDEVAELVTDVSRHDDNLYDHHICAVKIDGEWFYMHCWAFEILTYEQITKGYYDTHEGYDAVGQTIVGHRLVSNKNSEWAFGLPT